MRIEAVATRGFPPFKEKVHRFDVEANEDLHGMEDAVQSKVLELTGNVIRFRTDPDAPGELHVLTGGNGTGKTRLLCLLAAACGNPGSLDARGELAGDANQIVVAREGDFRSIWIRSRGGVAKTPRFDARDRTLLKTCKQGEIPHQASYVPSFRDASDGPLAAIAIGGATIAAESEVGLKAVELKPEQNLSFEVAQHDSHVICQGMVNLKISASLELARKPDEPSRAATMLGRLELAMTKVTKREFRIDLTPSPTLELRVIWGDVPMKVGQLPDGLRRIMAWLVSCVTRLDAQFPEHPNPLSLPLIMLIDEPENHLHPAWQRQILPAARSLFPQAQIFLATHSPFVISSANTGWIYKFEADESGAVTVGEPEECSKGDTYLDVVEDILGVSEWYDPDTEELLKKFYARRKKVLEEDGDMEDLRELALEIAERSRSLSAMMGREMHQVRNLTNQEDDA